MNSAVKIIDGRLQSDYNHYVLLSDNILLLYDNETESGTVHLVTVSLPDFQFINEKKITMPSSPSVSVKNGAVVQLGGRQAQRLDSGLNVVKTVEISENTSVKRIADISGDLSRVLYYDSEGMKTANVNYQNAKLLFRHPQWDDTPPCGKVYDSGGFIDNDTKVFAYLDGSDEGALYHRGGSLRSEKREIV